MKMADLDIDPFGEHDKTYEQPDTDESILFTPSGMTEKNLVGNQNENKKSCPEE